MRLSDRLQGLCAQSWAKTGLGKKPYNTKKYGTGTQVAKRLDATPNIQHGQKTTTVRQQQRQQL